MPYKNLKEFIIDLEKNDELIRIKEEVDPYLEITEITDRISKSSSHKNKALLFENPKGYEIPILINALGSHKRMKMALGVVDNENGYDAVAERIKSIIKPEIPVSFSEKLSKILEIAEIKNYLPKSVNSGICQEVVIKAEDSHLRMGDSKLLDKLPVITCWPDDGGPYITFGAVFTRDPDKLGSGRNVGMYRLQKFDDITTAMHWHKHHDGAHNYKKSLKTLKNLEGKQEARMEIAIAIGGDPLITYAATAPLPPGIDEMILAGFIRRKPVEMLKCKTIDIEVPANSEIVIEGFIDLNEDLITEGPFGDHTGFYSLADKYPRFHVTAVTHTKNPVYMTTIVGLPPQEDCYLGKATERIFLPLLQLICPEVLDMDLPWEGVFHNCALIKIDKKYAGHAFKVMNSIWGIGQLAWTKCIIVLDKEVDIHNYSEVALHAFGNTDPERDILFSKGPLDILDHASSVMGFGSKIGIDATRKWRDEGFNREWPEIIKMSDEIKKRVEERFSALF